VIVVVAGPPCSGKSTLGEALARKWNVPHLEMDAVRRRLMPESTHTREDRRVAYRAMHFAAELLVGRGCRVILDACYGHEEDRREVQEMSARLRARLLFVECRVPPEVAVERHRARRETHPGLDLTEARVEEMVRKYRFSPGAVQVDGTAPIGEGVAKIQMVLESHLL
jgi:predicted kinase